MWKTTLVCLVRDPCVKISSKSQQSAGKLSKAILSNLGRDPSCPPGETSIQARVSQSTLVHDKGVTYHTKESCARISENIQRYPVNMTQARVSQSALVHDTGITTYQKHQPTAQKVTMQKKAESENIQRYTQYGRRYVECILYNTIQKESCIPKWKYSMISSIPRLG